MKKLLLMLGCLPLAAMAFRPPAVPLVQCDPFFSVWSRADRLTDCETTHWSGAKQPVSVTLEADGKTWRLCGAKPDGVPALPQTGVAVRPTQTVYTFAEGGLKVTLTWSTPKLPENLDVFSRPVTYVTARVEGAKNWKLNAEISPALATNDDKAPMVTNTCAVAGMPAISIGRKDQKPLSASGDRVRCNWGYAWMVGPSAAKDGEAHMLLAYDDVKSLRFIGRELRAWWSRNGLSFDSMLEKAESERTKILARLDAFDAEFSADMRRIGGDKYAELAALAFRQSFAACKLVADANNQPMYFSKENSSNGCMGTVDLIYPQSPHLLLTSPTLMRASLAPILVYASSARWPWPFAPHDVGQYPLGDKQNYAGGETAKDTRSLMPVEESGNMLICLAALSQMEGNADFASGWWPTLTKWAEYLEKFGFDPGDQLCTDDFAGHLAHNANLAIKAIIGLASYANMAEMRGEKDVAAKYMTMAKEMALKWCEAAKGGRAGGYRLAYDQPDSWSMKYNLVWDRILGFNLFPAEVAQAEMKAYRSLLNKYGLPLDSRKTWTKSDWLVWCATLTGNRDDFDALIDGKYRFVNETPNRDPLSDWYWTDTGKVRGFISRSVVGGFFIPALYDKALWKKWSSLDNATTRLYAPVKTAAAGKAEDEAFNLATFNIRCPADKNDNAWSSRLPRILKVIETRGFDVIGLQEATYGQRNNLIAALPGWGLIGEGREDNGKGEASCIIYKKERFECLATDTFWLSETPRVPASKSWGTACTRVCTWGLFKDRRTGRMFRYYNTHLDHVSSKARVEGMKMILKEMVRISQGETVFLTGDLNDSFESIPAEEQKDLLKGCGPQISKNVTFEHPIFAASLALYDTALRSEKEHEGPRRTFHAYKPKAMCILDYVFTTGNVRVLRHVTCNDRPDGKFPSDHDAVFARVQIQ